MKPKSHALLVALSLAVFLAAGLILVLQMSFAPGNVYPPYSTLRSDPLGTSALLESLQAVPGQNASRHFQSLSKILPQAGATVLELGGNFDDVALQSPQNYLVLEELLGAGSRLIILSAPVLENLPLRTAKKEPNTEKGAEKSPPPAEAPTEEKKGEGFGPDLPHYISLCEKWGFSLEILPLSEKKEFLPDEKQSPELARPANRSGFTENLPWPSHLVFRNLHPSWQVLYEKEGRPVLIERRMGQGSIVLGSDAYFLSNEALRSDRRTDLILRVLGPGRTMIFKETQHGLHQNTGMADLLRRYRLHGTLACLFLLAVLFVWRSVFSLIPPGESVDETGAAPLGPTAREGMTHLLQRNLSPIQAFREGTDRWLKFCGKNVPEEIHLRARDYLFELRSDKKFNSRNIPEIYKKLQTLMSERK